jgi:hypothetical protein
LNGIDDGILVVLLLPPPPPLLLLSLRITSTPFKSKRDDFNH